MTRLPIALVLMLLASGAAAQAPSPRVVAPPPTTVRMPGVSPAGNAVLTKLQAQRDPGLDGLALRQRALQQRLIAIVNAPTVDVERLAAATREGQAIQSRARELADARLIATVRALPAADRKPFLKLVMGDGAAPQPGVRTQ